jgi:hypothetical protein
MSPTPLLHPNKDIELEPLHNTDTDTDTGTDTDDSETSQGMNRIRRGGGLKKQGVKKQGAMSSSSSVEFRRKQHSVDGVSSAQQVEALLERESFTLDDAHDPNKPAAASLMLLSPKDRRNFFLLVLLYFLQGVPMGLAMGSVPFLLKHSLSYGEIGVFSLASYPYSMKLLWSPIVDAIWSPKMGRRKSWIVPVQFVSSVMLLWLGSQAEKLMAEASKRLYFFTWVFFCLVMLCATQDVAVDGMFFLPSLISRSRLVHPQLSPGLRVWIITPFILIIY